MSAEKSSKYNVYCNCWLKTQLKVQCLNRRMGLEQAYS